MATEQVLIGCKLPHGLIMEVVDPGMMTNAEGRPIQGLHPKPHSGKRVILKGANSLRTNPNAAQGVFPYAVTQVDKDLWDAWIARHKDEPMVKNGFVFVAKSEKDAQAMGKERATERTGLEALSLDVDSKGKSVDPRLAALGRGSAHSAPTADQESMARAQGAAA